MPWYDPDNKYNVWNGKGDDEKDYASVTVFMKEENQIPKSQGNRHMQTELYDIFTSEKR